MPATAPSLAVKLTGTDIPDTKGRTLRAGPLSAELDAGGIRYVKFGGVEAIRGVSFLLRDENWGTLPTEIADLSVSEGPQSFEVTYRARCADGKRALNYVARITGAATGTLRFEITATPETDILTNRTGFVVLHPINGVAGAPLTIEHLDGRKVKDTFPELIMPSQPFFDIRALTHEPAPGLTVECRMDGDKWEMEDQRNWSDASYKTYVRSLLDPWPYTLKSGEPFTQVVTITCSGTPRSTAGSSTADVTSVELGKTTGQAMPQIALGVPANEAAPALAAASLVKAAGVKALVCEYDCRRSDNAAIAQSYARLAEAVGAAVTLEVVLKGGTEDPAAELREVAQVVRAAGLKPVAVIVTPSQLMKSYQPSAKWPAFPSYAAMESAARAAFPGLVIGGGMYAYFTELNRCRPPADLFDFVTHTVLPTVHAADDVSVMETLEALPQIIRSTRAFVPGKPYRIGPSSIAARDNPYGAAASENPHNGRVCLAKTDPRQRGLFGAAWTLGAIAAFAKGGIVEVGVGAPTGPTGIVAGKASYPQPYFDGAPAGAVYPVYHVVAGLTGAAGQPLSESTSSDPSKIVSLAYGSGDRPTLWLANLTDANQEVMVTGRPLAGAKVHKLNDRNFETLATDPTYFSGDGQPLKTDETVLLHPYGVARIVVAGR